MKLAIARYALAAVLAVCSCLASAQGFPNKPVTLVIPFAPGGASDIVGRLLADGLSKELGQSFIVENRGGAGGDIGAQMVIQNGKPDGHTLLFASLSLASNPALMKEKRFDPLTDLTAIGSVATMTNVIVLNPSLPIKSVRELLDYAKRNPGKLSFASAGTGSSTHLSAEMFKATTGVDLLHVPYKGSGSAMPDVIAGRVDLMFDLLASTLPYISKKQLHALAVTAPKRSPAAPDLPTVAEAGVPEYSFVNWFGVFAPAGTPRPVVEKINAAIARVVEAKDFKAILASKGAESSTGSPEDFATFFRSEVSRWDRLARDTKLAGTH